MDTTMDFTVLHAQRVEQAEREIARRLLIDESRIRPPRRRLRLWRTSLRTVARRMSRRRSRSLPSCAPACARRGAMAA